MVHVDGGFETEITSMGPRHITYLLRVGMFIVVITPNK